MNVAIESRRVIDLSTGEVIAEFGDRNLRPLSSEALKSVSRTIVGGRTPQTTDLSADYHRAELYWCPHSSQDLWLCDRCNYGLERTDGVKVRVATEAQRRAVQERPDIDWHYASPLIWFGRSPEGHDYALERGRITRVYSLRDRQDALAVVADYGLSAASRKTGIPRTTLNNWKVREAVAA